MKSIMYQFIPLVVPAYYIYRFIVNRLSEGRLKCFLNNTQDIILSKEEFSEYFRKSDHKERRLLFLHVMNSIKVALLEEDIHKLEDWFKLVRSMLQVIGLERFLSYGCDANNPIFKSNWIILASKYNKHNVLEHLLHYWDDPILEAVNGESSPYTGYIVDGEGHNVFYYIMQTCNINILDKLCDWLIFYSANFKDFNARISEACEDIKLRGVPFPEDMQYHIVHKLIIMRSYLHYQSKRKEDTLANIIVRLNSIHRAVVYITDNKDVVDDVFLHALKYIARNVHILKRQMKSTYIRLPWEEMEFCCIAFVLSHAKYDKQSLIYRSVLTKSKLKSYLTEFSVQLLQGYTSWIMSTENLSFLSSDIKRDTVVNAIKLNPVFNRLYEDFEQIMDVYSLNKINSYVELILSVDPHEENAHLIILRALQVIGEYMKNTLESPKLSNNAMQRLILSLPENIVKIIIDIRNCLSHPNFTCKRIELEQIMDVKFILKIQLEIKNLGAVVKDILHKTKISIIIKQLKKVLDTNSMQEITKILETFEEMQYGDGMADSFGSYIQSWRNTESFICLKVMYELTKNKSDKHCMREIKFLARNMLSKIEQNDPQAPWNAFYEIYLKQSLVQQSVQESIADILVQLKTDPKFRPKKMMTLIELADSIGFDIKRITQLRNIIKSNDHDHSKCKLTKENQDSRKTQRKIKMKALKMILTNTGLINPREKISYIKTNKKLLAMLEILVLDIMNNLCSYEEWVPNDWCYLDDRMPLLVGRNLRNHLAHGNIIVDILPFDHEAIIISNARILACESNLNRVTTVIHRVVTQNDPTSTEKRFYEDLRKICLQSNMYTALREGNLNYFLQCIENGADLRGRCAQSWTVFQYAVIGNNPEILDYLFNQNLLIEFKDENNGQSLLHIAVCNRSTLVLNYLIERNEFNIDDIDNSGKTPLHFATQYGFADIVQMLLRHKAQIFILDARGFLPLHLAVLYCFIEIVRCFLENGNEVDARTTGGFTSLHISAELGHLQISQFLIENHANINAVNDMEAPPLHLAALKGHVEIVELLIWNGADVNALSIVNAALHCAVEKGNVDIVLILLEKNADVNITERSNNGTPLNLAACAGHKKIVEILLAYRADVSLATKDNWNPLHNAARSGGIDIVRMLIEYGSCVNSETGDGRTALHIAAEYGQGDVVKFLVDRLDLELGDQRYKTPLHLAVEYGKSNVVDILIKKGASVNCRDDNGSTPLHLSALGGYSEITQKLISQGSNTKAKNKATKTPLHVAFEEGFEEIVEILMSAEANANAVDDDGCASIHLSAIHGFTKIAELLISKYDANFKNKDKHGNTPLHLSVEFNHLDIAALLINKGSNVNSKNKSGYTPLYHAVKNNNNKIGNLLIANGASVKGCYENLSLLHIAILKGSTDLAELLLKKGANIEELCNGHTPLFTAVTGNRIEMVEFLLTRNANINFTFIDGTTPLHVAATLGLDNIVRILISHGAKVNTKDMKNRTALEMAVAHDNLPVVKILLHQPHVNTNAKGNDDFTMLHIASQLGNLEVVKYLTDEGADVHAINNLGSKSIHIAAREGFKDVVQYFLDNELINLYDRGAGGSTLLHYAAIGGKTEIAEYLIKKDFDVNIRNLLGMMAIHQAALENHKSFIELLLHNSAIYDAFDYYGKRPIDYATNKDIMQSLKSIDNMFEAVRTNNWLEIKNCIKNCSSLNVRDQDECTLLHIAARTGRENIVKILLDHKADPNISSMLNATPLYHAVKSGAINIVKILLSYGAKYDAVSIEETKNQDIINLLTFIMKSFQKSQNGDCDLINDLKAIKDLATFKAVVKARNKDNKTIFVTAIHNDFPKIDKLKQIIQGDASAIMETSQTRDATVTFRVFTDILHQQTEKFGPDNVCALQIEEELALAVYGEQKYQEALSMCEKIHAKRKELLGLWDKDTLRIRSTMGLILNRQGKNNESLSMLEEVYQKQKDILDPGHDDILSTESHMALLLYDLKKYDEALDLNNKVLEKYLKMSRNNDPRALSVMNNIAMVLNAQGKHEKALESYREIYEKRKNILGPKHHLTLRSLCNIGHVHLCCNRNEEALTALREVFLLQKAALGLNHLDTLNTQNMIGHTLFRQGKYPEALKFFDESFAKRVSILGTEHADVLLTLKLINSIKNAMCISGSAEWHTLREEINAKDICLAAESGNKHVMELLIQKGVNVNSRDAQGRTALHFAICKGHKEITDFLLTNGADCTAATNKGNTALHTACVAGRAEIVNMLLEHLKNADRLELSSFVNTKTTVGGMTALHIASKNGFEEIVLLLLEVGAIYNCEEKQNKTPLDLTNNSNIKYLLQLINELFQDATNGKFMIIDKLQNIDVKYLTAVTSARDRDGCTLLRVSLLNKHTDIASLIVKFLK